MTVTGVIVFFFGNWILGYSSLTDSINHSKCDYLMFIRNLLRMDNVFTGMPHYWYLYEYLFLILAFPLLKSFVDYIEVNIKRTSLFLIISFVLVLVNDITANELFEFSHHSINGFMPAALLSIWGHILYKNRDYIKRWHSACAVVIFLLANISRYFVQTKRYYTGNVSIMSWYSSVGLICSMCVVCFCLSLMKGKKRENCFVNYISSYTLGIYLIHILVCNYLSVKKITEWIMNRTCNRFDSFFGELLYQFMIIVTVFGFCVAILLIIRVIKYLTYNCLNIIKSLILKEKQGNE